MTRYDEIKRATNQRRIFSRLARYIPNPKSLYNIGVGPLPKNEAVYLLEIFPHLKVFGCEPNPKTYRARLPTYPGELLGVALGESGTVNLYPDGPRSSLYPTPLNPVSTIPVPSITLDEFDDWAENPDGILLWMDVEGYESRILQSGSKLFGSGRVRWINVEVRTSKFPNEGSEANSIYLPMILDRLKFKRVLSYNDQVTHHDELWSL